jgi:hypothetical protein
MRRLRSQRILARTTVFLLLFGVAGLSTLAKQGKYLPRLNPLRHYSKSVKMERANHPVDFVPVTAQPVSRVVPAQPEFSATISVTLGPAFRQTRLAISSQHRAPPSLLA